jgi:hypothetical protein
MKAFKVYPFALTAGGSQVIMQEGSFFRILTATGALNVTFDDIGPFGPMNVGQGKRGPFRRLVLTDASGAAANVGSVVVADTDFVDQTLSGNVSVVDGGKSRTLSNSAFMATVFQAAVAAQMAHAQLWNPAASGKNLIVEAVSVMTSGASGTFGVGAKNAALATAYNAPAPKLLGGAAPMSLSFTQTNAVSLITAGSQLLAINATTNQLVAYRFVEPVVVPPGFGLIAWNNILNTDISANFEFFEEANQ